MLLQWHVKGPGHSVKSAGSRLHLNAHTPLARRIRSGLTMLSRHSVGSIRETSSHAVRQEPLGHSRLSSLSHCRPILALKKWNYCPQADLHLKKREREREKKSRRRIDELSLKTPAGGRGEGGGECHHLMNLNPLSVSCLGPRHKYQALSYDSGTKHTVAMGADRLRLHRRTLSCV